MKTDLIDVSETKKNLVIEIPSDEVDAEVARITRDLSRTVRVPGFRPGKVPTSVVKQRFREEILHEVGHALVPKAVSAALSDRGIRAGGDAGRARRGRPRGAAAQVHGVVRDGTAGRPRRLRRDQPSPVFGDGRAGGGGPGARAAPAARGALRADRRPGPGDGRHGRRRPGAAGVRGGGAAWADREARERVGRAGRGGQPAGVRRAPHRDARRRGEDVPRPLPRRLRHRGVAVEGRRVRGQGPGGPPPRGAAARRRPGEGSERRRHARHAPRAGARGAGARGRARGGPEAQGRPLQGALGQGRLRGAAGARRARRRLPDAGLHPPPHRGADSTRGRPASTGARSARTRRARPRRP